jgi:hypothetical protein
MGDDGKNPPRFFLRDHQPVTGANLPRRFLQPLERSTGPAQVESRRKRRFLFFGTLF